MHSPPLPTTTTTTYTTIPISGTDVIFRSFQNLSSSLSHRRPWPEFISTTASFDRPDSLPLAGARLRHNLNHFAVNYAIITTATAAVSLIGDPTALLLSASIFTLWLVLYFFREDPMVVFGRHVHDHLVIAGIVFVTGIYVWMVGFVTNLVIGSVLGFLMSLIHGVFRDTDKGVYLDENDAVSEGLISPSSVSVSNSNSPRDYYHRGTGNFSN